MSRRVVVGTKPIMSFTAIGCSLVDQYNHCAHFSPWEGLRIGYLIGNQELTAEYTRLSPYNVSSFLKGG